MNVACQKFHIQYLPYFIPPTSLPRFFFHRVHQTQAYTHIGTLENLMGNCQRLFDENVYDLARSLENSRKKCQTEKKKAKLWSIDVFNMWITLAGTWACTFRMSAVHVQCIEIQVIHFTEKKKFLMSMFRCNCFDFLKLFCIAWTWHIFSFKLVLPIFIQFKSRTMNFSNAIQC